jgi:hypothetical protein
MPSEFQKIVAKGKPIAEALEFVREEITKKSDQAPPQLIAMRHIEWNT